MKIDFERVCLYVDVAHTTMVERNIRKDFADMIYNTGGGIECHALALKVFNGNAETEYSERECELMRQIVERVGSPAIIDAVHQLTTDKEPR